jgi:hypothetical protein
MLNLVINDMAPDLGNFKPTHVTDGFTGSIYRIVHGVFDALGGGTNQLDLFVDIVTHEHILVGFGACPNRKNLGKKLPWSGCPARREILPTTMSQDSIQRQAGSLSYIGFRRIMKREVFPETMHRRSNQGERVGRNFIHVEDNAFT